MATLIPVTVVLSLLWLRTEILSRRPSFMFLTFIRWRMKTRFPVQCRRVLVRVRPSSGRSGWFSKRGQIIRPSVN